MPRDNKDNLTEEELVERFAKLFGHKPSSNKNIAKTSTSVIDLTKSSSHIDSFFPSTSNLKNTNDFQYKLPIEKGFDEKEVEKLSMSEPLNTPILINYDDQNKLNKVMTEFLGEEFTPSNKNFDENDDATRLIKEIQDEINLESKYKDNLYELKEKKEQDFIELEKRYKEFKIHATNENISNKNNISISSLGPPPKPIDLSEFGLDDYDLNNWCCICNEDAIIKCRDCDGDLYCQSCFNEGHLGSHSDYEMKQHKFEVYNRRMN
ncbi:hypothetical protein RhiirA5_499985 [Rhizophagus irregularis]|uniref:Uncharacterized protein n=1 Tax=Rhizophagus irregularis TaxID=588596 RepID=A0A2N0PNL2_9GLOM|nr:hypothetical protein RhiirA5_499985 [Rhizophagus irregularis]